jgi:hypothetical protein
METLYDFPLLCVAARKKGTTKQRSPQTCVAGYVACFFLHHLPTNHPSFSIDSPEDATTYIQLWISLGIDNLVYEFLVVYITAWMNATSRNRNDGCLCGCGYFLNYVDWLLC